MSFQTPKDIPSAQARRARLVQDIIRIQDQMTQRKPVGHVADAEWREYNAWRKTASTALAARQREAAFLNVWIKNQNIAAAARRANAEAFNFDPTDPNSLLVASYKALRRVYTEVGWEDVDEEEKALLDVVQKYLNTQGISP